MPVSNAQPLSAMEWRQRVARAAREGRECAECGRALRPRELIWRLPLRVESEWPLPPQWLIAPVCASCRGRPVVLDRLRACGECGRSVVCTDHDYWPWPDKAFCCDACAAGWWDSVRHQDLADGSAHVDAAARRRCGVCGSIVYGRGVSCSPTCRVRLSRRRKLQTTVEPLSA